jgi:predicted ester cyclase
MDLAELTRESFRRMFDEGDLEFVDETVGVDGVDHQDVGDDFRTHLKDVIVRMRTAFPDLHFELEHVLAEGDIVATNSTMTGTHEAPFTIGPFAKVPPTGKRIAVRHMHFFRYRDGHCVDLWHVWDIPGLMAQLTG